MASSNHLTELMNWAYRPEWQHRVTTVLCEHFDPACLRARVESGDLADLIGQGHAMTLFACAFEDFLTRQYGDEQRNVVEEFLHRHHRKIPALARVYMEGLRHSVMSLYEVTEIVPGALFTARDLLRGGQPVRVTERTAIQTLARWDRLAARMIPEKGGLVMAGGVLPLTEEMVTGLLRGLGCNPGREPYTVDECRLRAAAPLFTGCWLDVALDRVLNPRQPITVNTEGDAIEFHEVRYPLLPDAAVEAVGLRLTGIAALERTNDHLWNWQAPAAAISSEQTPADGVVVTTEGPDGGTVLGTVELAPEAVVLRVNSRARAARGQELLGPAIAGLVRPPLVAIETLEQVLACKPGPKRKTGPDLSPEEHEGMVRDVLERHYRAVLDQPVPALGNRTPRAAARSAAGRRQIVAWLKYLENQAHHARNKGDPVGNYDFGWMWKELGVAALRG